MWDHFLYWQEYTDDHLTSMFRVVFMLFQLQIHTVWGLMGLLYELDFEFWFYDLICGFYGTWKLKISFEHNHFAYEGLYDSESF